MIKEIKLLFVIAALVCSVAVNAQWTGGMVNLRDGMPTNDTQASPFTVNLENPTVSSFLSEVTYTEDVSSKVANYTGTSTGRLDHPNCVSISVPENNAALTVTVSLNSDYSDPEIFAFAAGTTLCKIYNLVPQKTYYYKVEAGGEILKQGEFTTEGHLRMIMTETGFNIRDLGGWSTIDDNRTAYGKLFRGGELNCGHTVSAADLAELRRLGIGAELDLRRDGDCNNIAPTASVLVDNDDYLYMNQGYDDLTLENATNKGNIKRAFQWVLDKLRAGKAVYFHCRIGADRTGMYALVFGGLSGMTFDQLCKDYELTSFSEAGLRQWDSDGVNTLKTNLNYIKAQPGKTLQMQFYNYMYREVGVSANDLMDYISIITDGESSILNASLAFNNEDGEYIPSLSDITALCAAGSEVAPNAKAQLSDGTTTTDVQMSIDGIVITFSGPDLEPNKEYTLTIPANAIGKGGTWNAESPTLTFHTRVPVVADPDNIDAYVGQLVTIQNLRIGGAGNNMTATYNATTLTPVDFPTQDDKPILYDGALVDLTGIVSREGTKTILTATDRRDLDPVVFVIDEDKEFVSPDDNIQDVVVRLKRTLSKDYWNTFCVPFSLPGIPGEIGVFTEVEGSTMIFTWDSSFEAGKPYLVKPDDDIVNPVFRDIELSATAAQDIKNGDFHFMGTYGPTDMGTENGGQQVLFLKSDGKLYTPAPGNNRIKGMRAYFRAPKGAEARVSIDGAEQTVIGDATRLNDKGKMINDHVYDLQGRRLSPLSSPLGSAASLVEEPSSLKKGLYIVNGKKLLVR